MGRPKNYDREQLLRSARDLFWEAGFAKTSLQDLERVTGVNKSGLYSEFKSKDEMFFQCLKQYADESGIFELLNKEPLGWGNIKTMLSNPNRACGRKGCFMVNTVREFKILPAKVKAKISNHLSAVKELLVKNLKAESIPSAKANLLAEMILTFNSGLALGHNLDEHADRSDQVEAFLKAIQ
jgi:TetR/AcrR family transcriptional regulator, copper-responsive repressor